MGVIVEVGVDVTVGVGVFIGFSVGVGVGFGVFVGEGVGVDVGRMEEELADSSGSTVGTLVIAAGEFVLGDAIC